MSQEQISQLENNNRKFTQKTLDKLLKSLETDYEHLFVRKQAAGQPLESLEYRKWNNDIRKIGDLEKANVGLKMEIAGLKTEVKNCREIITYAKENCTKKTCPIVHLLHKRSA